MDVTDVVQSIEYLRIYMCVSVVLEATSTVHHCFILLSSSQQTLYYSSVMNALHSIQFNNKPVKALIHTKTPKYSLREYALLGSFSTTFYFDKIISICYAVYNIT